MSDNLFTCDGMTAVSDFDLRYAEGLEERRTVALDDAQEARWAEQIPPPVPQVPCPGSGLPAARGGTLIGTCPVCSLPFGMEHGRIEPHSRDSPLIDGPAEAKARRRVRLANGRVATLIYWPVPAADRRAPSRSSGIRAKVEIRPGVVISVKPHELTFEEGL